MGPGMFDGVEKAVGCLFCLVFAAGVAAAFLALPAIRFIATHVSIH